MIEALVLRWFVTVLFALAAGQCVYAMVRVKMPWPAYVGHLLHLVMSVAMLLMAWPFSMSWPTTGPMVFFIVAAAWFLVSIAIPVGDNCGCAGECSCVECSCVPATSTVIGRLTAGYHAVMMGAMAWMYAVMNGSLLPGGHSSMSMPMAAGPGTMFVAHEHGGSGGGGHGAMGPSYVEPINWLLGIGFLLAAAVWLYIYFDKSRRAKGVASQRELVITGDLCQAFMAAGMSIMFLTMVL